MTNASISAGIPCDALFILHPAVLWLRDASGSVGFFQASGRAGPVRRFTLLETEILDYLSVGATKTEILNRVEVEPADLMNFLDSLHMWSEGVLGWQDRDPAIAQADHQRLTAAARLRDIAIAMNANAGANDDFHRTELVDTQRQFDEIETTISHIFREPHIALDNRSYGQAFCDWLVISGRIGPSDKIIEIGCGLGFFANAILGHLEKTYPEIYASLSYTLFDLSPELQSAQKANCARHAGRIHFISGNIETYDFGKQSFDLALSNEVIADLSVATISLDNIRGGSPRSDAEILAHDFQLSCVPIAQGSKRMAVINSGAIKMLQNLDKCLDENGYAVITEYGSMGQSPKAVQFSNHAEFTVHFGQLEEVARQLGFTCNRGTMGDIIGYDADCKTIRLESFRTLCDCILPYLGRETLPVLAYTPASLEAALGGLAARIGNLQFRRLDDPESFSPFRFELLSLSRGHRDVVVP